MEVGNNSKRLQELYDGLIKDNYDLNSIGRNIDEFAEKLATDTVFSNFVYDDLRGKTGFSGSKADFLVKALGSRVVPSSISKGRKTVPPYKPNKNEYVHFETPIKNVLGGGEKTAEDYAIDALEATGRATPITPQDRYSFQKRNVVDNINAQTIVDTAQRKNIANKQRADLSITGRYLLPEDIKEREARRQDEAKATAIEYQKAEKAQRQQIDDTLRSLKEKAQKDYNEYAAQLREQEEKIPAFIRADKDAYVSTTAADLAMSVPAATLKLVDDTEKLLNAPKKGGNWANSMWAGAKDAADAESFFSFGLSGLAKSATIKGVTDRYLEGKNLTDKENDLMEALATNTLVAYMRKDDVSGWYTAGQIAEMSAEISTQFLGTNFIGSAATKAVARGIGKFISKNAPKIVAKLATKGLGGTALRGTRFVGKGAIDTFVGGTAQSLFMPNTYDSAIQTKTGTVAFGEGKGQYDVTPSEYNLAQSLVSGAIESVSERAGGAFAGFGGKVAKNIIPTSWGKLSSKGIVGDIIKAGGTANRYLSKAGINGQFGELAEEGFGQVLNRINGTATKEEWANFWSKDNMLQMIGGFAPMSLVGLGANTISVAKSSLDAYRADRALLNFARQNNIAAPKKMLDEIKNVEIENLHKVIEEYVQELGGVSDNKLNDIGVEFNKLAANVVAHNIRKDIYAEADSEISPAESVSTDERQEVTEENIQEERQPDYTIPQLRQGDEVEYDNAQWIVGDVADEDGDYQVGEESIPLRRGNVLLLGADGESVQVIDSAADLYPKQQNVDDESKRQAIYEQYRPVMNVDTGNITQLSNVAGTDNIAYVVKGKVVYDEDGNIDYDKSDDTIYYKVYDQDGNEVDGGTPKPIYLKTRRTEFGKVLSDVPIEEYVDNELYPQEQNNIQQAINNGPTNIEQSTPAESVTPNEYQDITEKNDSTGFDENGGYSNIQNTVLSDEGADLLMSAMEDNAEAMPVIELTPDNWVAEFGQNRTVSTPIGDVKMGDNQLAKLFLKKRTREFGMIKPTLINPDVIIEKTAVADNAERNTKLLFVKTFKDENGRKHVHFENVTVQKGGLEVSISSHIVDKSAIRKELANGIVIYNKPELTSIGSDVYLTETHEGQSDLVPTQKANSDLQYKGTINNLNEQGEFYNSLPRNKKGEVDENQMSAEQKIRYAQAEFGEDEELVKEYISEQSKALSDKIAKLANKSGKSVAEFKELAALKRDKITFVEYLNEQRQQAAPRQTVEEAAAEREATRREEQAQYEQMVREREEREGVPDFLQDTPEDARLRGFRLRTGERIDRQEPIEVSKYNTARRKFTNDTGAVEEGRPTVKRTIIDNAETKLQPSHRGGRSNIYHFITEAQPKERTDKASRVSAAQIAANINPEEITGGITAYNGSPIANNRLEVIQGNNRAEALRLMYEEYPKSAEAYKQYLIDNAENYGMSADEVRTMKEPIAVDIYEGTDGDAILLGQYTQQDVESGGVHRINPSGVIKHLKSQNMLDRFITGLLKGVDEENTISDVISSNLRGVLPILDNARAISLTQRQGFFDEKGDVTSGAIDDFKNILTSLITEGGYANINSDFLNLPESAKTALYLQTYRAILNQEYGQQILGEIQDSILLYTLVFGKNNKGKVGADEARREVMSWLMTAQPDFNTLNEDGTYPLVDMRKKFSNFAAELTILYKSTNLRSSKDKGRGLYNIWDDFYNLLEGKGDLFTTGEKKSLQESINENFNIDYVPIRQNERNTLGSRGEASRAGRRGSESELSVGEQSEAGTAAADDRGRTEADIAEAVKDIDVEPTEAQKKAGNYKKGHVKIQGFDITIENPKGAIRKGVDDNGKAWSTEMKNHYGYFKNTEGKDGDHIDVFIGDNPNSKRIFVVDQVNPKTKEFDESKVMLGFDTEDEAKKAYLSNYSKDWKGFKDITYVDIDTFKEWLYDGAKQRKPFGEYSNIRLNAAKRKARGATTEKLEELVTLLKKTGFADVKTGEDFYNALAEIEGSERYSSQSEKKLYNPRGYIAPVRGKWTKEKIKERLRRSGGSLVGYNRAAELISEFNSPEELAENIFYHGTVYGSGRLKPSILMSDMDVERYGGGGYGDKYWGISVSRSKKIASNFSGTSAGVSILPIVLAKGAKVKEMPDLKDSADIDDVIVDLWKEGVDAVWVGGKNKGEQELCVINPRAIVSINRADIYQVYGLGGEENPINIIDKEGIKKLYEDAKQYWEQKKIAPKGPLKPFRFYLDENNHIGDKKPDDVYDREMKEYEEQLRVYESSDEHKKWQRAQEYARDNIRFMIGKQDTEAYKRAIADETADIKAKAISDGTFMKAPNGKDTNLTERQWLQVRTKAFKKWFGDWEKAYKLELIENLHPIGVDNKGLSRERAEEEYKKIGTSKTNRYDNRRIEFVNNAFGKIARHKNSALIFDIIPQLNDLFESAIPIYFEEEREPLKSTNIVGSHNYLGKVRVNNEDYYVRITAQELTPSWKQNEKQGKSNFHNMAVSDIAIYDESGSSVTAKDYSIDNDNRNRFVDAKLQHFFKTAREARKNSSKVIDENGEPMVVYHGTNKFGFTVFDKEFSDDKTSIFFTDRVDIAKGYAGVNADVRSLYDDDTAGGYSKDEMLSMLFADVDISSHTNGWDVANDILPYITEDIGITAEYDDEDGVLTLSSDYTGDTYRLTDEEFSWEKVENWLRDNADLENVIDKDAGIYGVFVNARNVLDIDAGGSMWSSIPKKKVKGAEGVGNMDTRDIVEHAKKLNYDGVYIKDLLDTGGRGYGLVGDIEGDIFISLVDKNQIKSVTDNIGTFDGENEDIRYRRPNGTVLGFVKGNTIYLNPDEVSLNTPIHEFGHLWVSQVKGHFPELWEKGKELFLESDYLRKVQADPNYRHLDLDGQIDEAMARAIGDRGEQELDKTLLEKILDWIAEVWDKIGGVFGIENLTSEQISNLTLQDFTDMATSELLSGQNLTERVNGNRGGDTRYNTADETADIKAKAISEGTFMKAPNGKDTNLTERQWLQVRTKAFKRWFGDWEKAARIEKLKKTKPIEITGEEYKDKYELNRDSAKSYIKDSLRGEYTNKDTGDTILLAKDGAQKVTSHSMGNEAHLKSIAVIPELIEKSIFIDELPNEKNNSKYDSYRYYVSGLKIGDVDYTVKLAIGIDEYGNKYYDHSLTEIEKGKLIDEVGALSTTLPSDNQSALSEYKDSKLISLLQTNSSKVVDENGEPLVVYHGTWVSRGENYDKWNPKKEAPFYQFNKSDNGIHFGTEEQAEYIIARKRRVSEEDKGDYTGFSHIYASFLNIRNMYETYDAGLRWAAVISEAKSNGYDGLVYGNTHEGRYKKNSYVVFNPTQIKSATDNIGTFDGEDEDIRYSVEGADYFVNERFNEQLEKLTEENADSTIFYLGEPSAEMLAVGIKDSPLKLYGNKLQSKAKKHGFDVKDIKDLPEAIHDPIAIFEGAEDGSFAILTELSVGDNNVLATLSVGKGNDIDFNIVSSVYGKYNKNVVGWINKGKMLYVNKEKALDYLRISAPIAEAQDKGELNPSASAEKTFAWQATLAPIASATLKQELVSAAKIIENFENPPIDEKKVIDDTTNDMVRYSIQANSQLDKEDEIMGKKAAEIYEARVKMGKQMNQSDPKKMPNKKIFDEINRKTENSRAKTAEHAADCYLPMKHLIEIFNKHGYNIADYNNWYMNVFALAGKNEAEYEKYQAERSKPLQRAAKAAMDSGNISYRELENYLILKHGQERNRYFAERDKSLGIEPLKDYSGVEAVMFEEFCKRTGIEVKTQKESVPQLAEANNNIDILYADGVSEFSENGRKLPIFEVERRFAEWKKVNDLQSIIADYEQKIGKDKIDDLWAKINYATQFVLDMQKAGGLTSEKMYEKASGMWKYFVPLRGFDVGTAKDEFDYDLNGVVLFTDFKVEPTLGRTRRSTSPLVWTEQMAHITIDQKNRNLLNQSLRRLASISMARRDNILLLSKLYKDVDAKDEDGRTIKGEVKYPPKYTGDTEHDAKAYADWIAEMKAGIENGTIEEVRQDNVNFGKIVPPAAVKQHIVRVYEGGVPTDVIFNTPPAVPRAINGLNHKTAISNHWIYKNLKAGTRMMAQTMTTLNPAFVGKNFSRDYLFANTMLFGREDMSYVVNFNKNITKATPVLLNYVKGKSLLGWAAGDKGNIQDNEYGKWLTEFVMNGGKTGFSQMLKFEKMSNAFKKQTEKGDKKVHYGVNDYIHFIEALNDYAENITRFSAYCASRQAGRSVERSISDAKELTINFNRKGTDGGIWGAVRSLCAFSNASIQALVVFSRGVRANPKRMSVLISGYTAMAITMAVIAKAINGDDDKNDYFKLSKFDRQNNLCLPMFGGGFLKIPLPQEMRVFYKLGDEIALCLFRNEPPEVAAQEVFMGALDLLPSFAAGATSISDVLDEKIGAGDLLLAHQPITAIQPITQLMSNRNFLNYRIYDDSKWGGRRKELPEYRKALRNKGGETYSPNFVVKLSEGISRLTGGSDLKRGVVEVNPDVINHLMRGYFGGLYSSAVAAINMGDKGAQSIAAGEIKMKTTDSPTMKAFYVSPSNLRYTDDILNAQYMDVMKEAKKHANVYANYLKEGEVDRFEKETKMTEDEALDWRYLVKGIDKEVQELRNEIAIAETTKERDEALRQLETLQREAIDMAAKLKK